MQSMMETIMGRVRNRTQDNEISGTCHECVRVFLMLAGLLHNSGSLSFRRHCVQGTSQKKNVNTRNKHVHLMSSCSRRCKLIIMRL